jgi:hypothetical protein
MGNLGDIDILKDALLAAWSGSRPAGIAATLIAAYRRGDRPLLERFAQACGIVETGPGRTFMRLIGYYHPDRAALRRNEILALHAAGDIDGLMRMDRLLRVEPAPVTENPAADNPCFAEDAVFDDDDDGWHEEFADGDWPHEADDQEPDDTGLPDGLAAALATALYDDPYHPLTATHLADLDGELDLADSGIDELAGIEGCHNVTSLDLSGNRISEVGPLAALERLEELNLSFNLIHEIDALACLSGLLRLDLAGNRIDSVEALVGLTRLEYLNLAGNPVTEQSLAPLYARGVFIVR